jgi:4-amino-4-deoxychorismate lyase
VIFKLILINGQVQTQIAVSDRALHYGDGCFTTLAFAQGKLLCWPRHLARLKNNCARLDIDFDHWNALSTSLEKLCKEISAQHQEAVIKIIITRGQGGRGYSPTDVKNPSYIISTHEFPARYSQWQNKGINLTVSPVKLGKQPLLAGIKHLNRLEQVLIKQKLVHSAFDDALVCNNDNEIIESSAGNIFWLQNGSWFTPYLDECGVEGVMRNLVCDILKRKSLVVKEVRQVLNLNFYADEMFICNSLMQLVPVNSLQMNDTEHEWQFACENVKNLQHFVREALINE